MMAKKQPQLGTMGSVGSLGAAIGEKLRAYMLPFQWNWFVDESLMKLGRKSRRTGWTYIEACRAVVKRLKGRNDYFISSADETAGREFQEYVRFWADFIGQAKQIVDDDPITDDAGRSGRMFVFANGKRIVSLTSNPRQFRSKGGDATWDEAAHHDNPAEMWAAIQPTTMWGGQLSVFSNPNSEGDFFDQLCADARKQASDASIPVEAKWSYYEITIVDAVADGLAERIAGLPAGTVDQGCRDKFLAVLRAKARDQQTYDREYMCKSGGEQTVLLPYDLIRSCSVPADQVLGCYGSGHLYGGLDVGRVHDLTAFGVAEDVSGVLMLRNVEVMRNMPYRDQQRTVLDFWRKRPLRRFCGDATGIGDMLIEDLQHAFGAGRVEKVKFGEETKEDLAMALVERFQDRRILIPDDADLRTDLHAIRKLVTSAKNVRYDAARNADGHADRFWMLALAVMAAGRNTRRRIGATARPVGL